MTKARYLLAVRTMVAMWVHALRGNYVLASGRARGEGAWVDRPWLR